MKKIILAILFCLLIANVYAAANTDSLAYQAQRKKINAMLAQRKLKFGQYDQSLSQHTGIFGLQTKKDIRNSNNILMDIVKTDDDILIQTKILLEYRTFVQSEVQSKAQETDSSNIGLMNAINRLRTENDQLKKDADATLQEEQKKKSNFAGHCFGAYCNCAIVVKGEIYKKGLIVPGGRLGV